MADDPGSDTAAPFDLDQTVDRISEGLFSPEETPVEDGAPDEALKADDKPKEEAKTEPAICAAPKTWPKDMHPHWEKTPKEVQDYWQTREKQMLDGLDQYKGDASFGKSLRDVFTPYQPIIKAAGVDEATAVKTLLTAHARLTQGTPEQRHAAYQELGRNLGLTQDGSEAAAVDPTVKAVQDRLQSLETMLTAREQAAYTEAQAKISKEVEAFATDPAHPYFDEVHDDMVKLITVGYSLQEAYTKAVRMNDVTYAKELARVQTEQEATRKENARLEALPKKQAASVNVRSRDTNTAPTEPLGTMEDTIKSTWHELRSRVH